MVKSSFGREIPEGIGNMVLDEILKKGIKNIGMRHSSVFAIHTETLVEHIKNGVVTSFEGNLNGGIGYD